MKQICNVCGNLIYISEERLRHYSFCEKCGGQEFTIIYENGETKVAGTEEDWIGFGHF